MNPTGEQQTFIDLVGGTNSHVLVTAVAGSGKTSTLLEALKVIPQKSILMCAYNKRIAEELTQRAPKLPRGSAMHIKTFHALGLGILKAHYPRLTIDKNGTETIIAKALGDQPLGYPQRRAAVKLLRQYKELDVSDGVDGAADLDSFYACGRNYDLFDKLTEVAIEEVCAVVSTAYMLSHRPQDLETIDFCDMIWMPIALNLQPRSRYQAIIVDEYQDISEPQLELIRRLRAPKGGRLIMAGDDRQAINLWRAAVPQVVRNMMQQEGATELTLTTSFRCSAAVIGVARELVPNIRACDDALEGSVSNVGLCDVPRMIFQGQSATIHTFILSRNNAALLDTALYLWREGVRFQLNAGQDLLAPLFELLDKLNLSSEPLFRSSLTAWHKAAKEKAEDTGAMALVERVNEQHEMLLSAIRYTKPSGLRRLFQSILEPGKTGVLLSTVHKVKGLEAERVFLLKQTFKRHGKRFLALIGRSQPINQANRQPRRVPIAAPGAAAVKLPDGQQVAIGDWVDDKLYTTISISDTSDEDLNIEYVAITRAKEHLIWVDMNQRDLGAAPDLELDQQLLRSLTIEGLEKAFDQAEGEIQRLASLGDNDAADEWAQHAKRVQVELSSRQQ